MVAFLIVRTIAGVILGLRFEVFVLGPATLLATVAITVTGMQSAMKPGQQLVQCLELQLRCRSDILQATFFMPWYWRTCFRALSRTDQRDARMPKFALIGTIEIAPGRTEEFVPLLMAHRTRCL
jgi:hypothetical protein